jgi:hypothetical protein
VVGDLLEVAHLANYSFCLHRPNLGTYSVKISWQRKYHFYETTLRLRYTRHGYLLEEKGGERKENRANVAFKRFADVK